ncbi:hypothetical protein [Sagittula sp. S175]|uniref:hypothetical protein n=1 Tax=Sagittula sp. S175 TaxID=3415129 RepID=UPI003C7C9D97
MRPLIALFVALTLAVTSLSAGVARGQAAPAGVIELCQGLTTVSVAVDADGAPVSHVHLCPDGVMSLLAGIAPVVVVAAPSPVWDTLDRELGAQVLAAQAAPRGVARGPPSLV